MSIVESIKKGFSLSKKAVALIIVLSVINIIIGFINLAVMPPQPPVGTPPAAPSPAVILVGIIFFFIGIFIQAGIINSSKELVKKGAAAVGDFTKGALQYFLPLLALGLCYLVLFVMFAIIIGVVVGIASVAGPILAFIGGLIAVAVGLLGLYFFITLSFAPYALIVDGKGIIESLKESSRFVRPIFWRIVGLFLIMIAIALLLALILGGILLGIGLILREPNIIQSIRVIISGIINAYIGLAFVAALIVFYMSNKGSEFKPGPVNVGK